MTRPPSSHELTRNHTAAINEGSSGKRAEPSPWRTPSCRTPPRPTAQRTLTSENQPVISGSMHRQTLRQIR